MTRVLILFLLEIAAFGQGTLTNGQNHAGEISTSLELDAWTFSANAGESISIAIGNGTPSSLWPWLRLQGPGNTELAANFSNQGATSIDIVAPATGTYTVLVGSSNSIGTQGTATGKYQITLAKTPGAFTVSDGDQGGTMTNGANHQGAIHLGDLDMWSFTAAAGDAVSVAIGKRDEPGYSLWPWIRLRGPDGALLAANFSNQGATAIDVTVNAS